jgi:hypothetical protein
MPTYETMFTDPSVDYMSGSDGSFADNYQGTVEVDYDSDPSTDSTESVGDTTSDPTQDFDYSGDTVDEEQDYAEPSRRSLGGTSPGPGPSTPDDHGLSGTVLALLVGFVVLVVGGGAAVVGGD